MTRPVEGRFWEKVDKSAGPDGCWIWMASTGLGGYGTFWDGTRQEYAHRVAWRLVNGPISKGLHVCHRCDVSDCVNPNHLFLGTAADNAHDSSRKGRRSHKLTAQDVLAIRAHYAKGGITYRALGATYGVTLQTIRAVVLRITWRHVE